MWKCKIFALLTHMHSVKSKKFDFFYLIQPSTSSILLFAAANCATTLLCATVTLTCLLGSLALAGQRRRRRQWLTDRLAAVADSLWLFEQDVERLIR